MSITAEEIEKVVLSEDDFGHEMRVGNILKPENVAITPVGTPSANIMRPKHGGTYADPMTDKPRQYDFRSQIHSKYNGSRRIYLALECKNLNPDFPLVVCGRPRTVGESYHVFFSREGEVKRLRKVDAVSSLYKPNAFVGKSLLRLKRKTAGSKSELCSAGDSEIYDKWSQALASCHELANEAAQSGSDGAFVMPLVVVPDKSLWRVIYSDDGKPEGSPVLIEECYYYVAHKLAFGLLSHLHFITLKGLKKLLSDFAMADSHIWDEIFSESSSRFDQTL